MRQLLNLIKRLKTYLVGLVRADAQYSKRGGKVLFNRLFEKIESGETNNFVAIHNSLNSKGIYLGEYKINEKSYKMALYSNTRSPQIKKLELEDYCDIVNDDEVNKYIKVTEIENSLILAFFKEGEIEFMVQMMG